MTVIDGSPKRAPRITLDCKACGRSVPREIARDGLCHGCYTAAFFGTDRGARVDGRAP